jgi:hypothetical protein
VKEIVTGVKSGLRRRARERTGEKRAVSDSMPSSLAEASEGVIYMYATRDEIKMKRG